MGRFYKPTNFTPEEVMFELPKEAAASAINYVDQNLTLNEQTAAELSNSFDTYYKNVLPYDQPYVKEYLNKYKPIIDEIAGKMSNSQDWRNHQGALLQLSRDFKNDITTGNLSKFLQEKAASDADQKKAQEMIKIGEGKGGTNDTFAKLLLGKSFKDHSATTSYDPKTGTWHSYKSNLLSTSDLQDEYFKYAEKFKADKTSDEWQTDSKDGMWRSTNKQTGEVVSENDIKRGFHEFISGNPQYANQISVGENVGYYSGMYEKDDKGDYKVDAKGNKIPIPITIQKEVVDSRTGKKHMVDVYNPEHISNKFSAISANAFGYSNTSTASSREETEANKSSLIAGREAAHQARADYYDRQKEARTEAATIRKEEREKKTKAEEEAAKNPSLVTQGTVGVSEAIEANTHAELFKKQSELTNTKLYLDKLPAGQEKDALLAQYQTDLANYNNKLENWGNVAREAIGSYSTGLTSQQLLNYVNSEKTTGSQRYEFDDATGKAYKITSNVVGGLAGNSRVKENKTEVPIQEYKQSKVREAFSSSNKKWYNPSRWSSDWDGNTMTDALKNQKRHALTGEYNPTTTEEGNDIWEAVKNTGEKVIKLSMTDKDNLGKTTAPVEVDIKDIGNKAAVHYAAGVVKITNDKGEQFLISNPNVVTAFINTKKSLSPNDVEVYNDNNHPTYLTVRDQMIPQGNSVISTKIKHEGNEYPITYKVKYMPNLNSYNAYTVINGIENTTPDNPVPLDINSITRWVANPEVK